MRGVAVPTVFDHHRLAHRSPRRYRFNSPNHIHTFHNFAEDDVLAIEVRCLPDELGSASWFALAILVRFVKDVGMVGVEPVWPRPNDPTNKPKYT